MSRPPRTRSASVNAGRLRRTYVPLLRPEDPLRFAESYSCRSEWMGSTRLPRSAGNHAATRATPIKMSGTTTKTRGSQGLTPKRKLAIPRVKPKAAARPHAEHAAGVRQILQKRTPSRFGSTLRCNSQPRELRDVHRVIHRRAGRLRIGGNVFQHCANDRAAGKRRARSRSRG